ncbi:hypothetical protein [Nocardioides euryhalodurans]|uniref:Uncharacterized protein n=1 Tax=Nocardioides euryhalodurans TaxID=2518370 RepID=A0A4P7GK83_9ACTN|nr:hypothetical protein [Nocardioides euryhalodurans]QBR92333.1 hypothetical protein EXE57_08570 [Nocardioides euryhalodurans]
MNLEEELCAVLRQEAEVRTTPTPDIEAMVEGGETRLRRRNTMRMGLAAAAVLLVGGGTYGATQLDNALPDTGVVNQPSETPEAAPPQPWADNDQAPAEAGTYRTDVGNTEAGVAIEADFTIDGEGWRASNYPVANTGQPFAGLGVYQPESVGGGCRMAAGYKDAATAPQQLVQQLIHLPRSQVVQQPAPTEAFGRSAVHLQLRIDAGCAADDPAYLVADGPAGDRGISYFDESPQGDEGMVIIDFWVVDVDGTSVVVDRFHLEDAPDDLVAQSTRAVESITFRIEE